MIAIKSNKPLTFDPVTREMGTITVSIESYIRNPINKTFTLNIVDLVEYESSTEIQSRVLVGLDENNEEVYEIQPKTVRVKRKKQVNRTKTYPEAQLIELAQTLGITEVNISNIIYRLDELFLKGLLAITQQECLEGKGIYLSEAEDWEIVTPQ